MAKRSCPLLPSLVQTTANAPHVQETAPQRGSRQGGREGPGNPELTLNDPTRPWHPKSDKRLSKLHPHKKVLILKGCDTFCKTVAPGAPVNRVKRSAQS